MTDPRNVVALLGDAIALLEANGLPLAAESLRDGLRAIDLAPTAGARRRRIFQLRDRFAGTGPAREVFFCSSTEGDTGIRFARSEPQRRDQERYRLTLGAIRTLLESGPADDSIPTGGSPVGCRVA